MLILRKGKKIIKEYAEAYAIAEDVETLRELFPEERIRRIQFFLEQNAFTFAIKGAKARLGGGVMVENRPAA